MEMATKKLSKRDTKTGERKREKSIVEKARLKEEVYKQTEKKLCGTMAIELWRSVRLNVLFDAFYLLI